MNLVMFHAGPMRSATTKTNAPTMSASVEARTTRDRDTVRTPRSPPGGVGHRLFAMLTASSNSMRTASANRGSARSARFAGSKLTVKTGSVGQTATVTPSRIYAPAATCAMRALAPTHSSRTVRTAVIRGRNMTAPSSMGVSTDARGPGNAKTVSAALLGTAMSRVLEATVAVLEMPL